MRKVRKKMLVDFLWINKRLVGVVFVGRDETVGRFVEEKQVAEEPPEKREEEQRVGEHHQGAACAAELHRLLAHRLAQLAPRRLRKRHAWQSTESPSEVL